MQDALNNLGSSDVSEEEFEELFKTFDKDNSGTIEKEEMVVFL